MPSSGVWALSLRLTCCPGPFWRCGRAKALLERFLEITAPSRALSSLCRIDPQDGSGPRSTRLDIGEQKRDNPDGAPPTVRE